jgi:hypothetical protein
MKEPSAIYCRTLSAAELIATGLSTTAGGETAAGMITINITIPYGTKKAQVSGTHLDRTHYNKTHHNRTLS